MSVNYGKLAYQKTEEISKKLKFDTDIDRIMVFSYFDTAIIYDTTMFSHTFEAIEGSVLECNIVYSTSITPTSDITARVYVNGIPVFTTTKNDTMFSFVSSGTDIVEVYFSGVDELSISNIRFTYTGKLLNNLDSNIMYFDENSTSLMYYCNGVLTKYTTLDDFISAYKYITHSKDLLCANSIISSTKKTGFYAIYYDEESEYIVLRNLSNTTKYNLVQIKPDNAIFIPINTATYRVIYVLNNRLYFFNTSRFGTNISTITEVIGLDNFKIKSVFPLVVVNGNTTNVQSIGVLGTDGVAYILRYDDTLKNYVGKKYIGKCDYASGYYNNDSINIVLYNAGVATIKTYSDRMITNMISERKYYNCYRIFNVSETLIGLNFEGLSILT